MMFRKMFAGLLVSLISVFVTSGVMAVEGPVLVFGGTSGTGLATVQVLRAQDVPVTVFVRPTSDTSVLEPLGVKTVVGNALNADDVNAAFASGSFKTVVSSLGGRRGEPRPDLEGNKNITAGAKATGAKRVIQISSIGAGETREPPGEDANFMAGVLYMKTLAEDDLIASGLDYTVIRPGGLRRGVATGTGVVMEEERMGSIDRQELGRLVVQVLNDPSTVGKVLYAIDPALPVPDEE
ncbi:MAG: NAD(P)H-binding protein [Alphaproteobacteria bacterium]|nr:NAD(P)H-binding protein [Alphaproteobacteria bacterium]